MCAYLEGKAHHYYDVIAMRKVWEFLKEGGKAYVSVPFGGYYLEIWPHWRVYNMPAAIVRLAQDFRVLSVNSASASECQIDGRTYKPNDVLTQEEVSKYSGMPPHISTLLVMEKCSIVRLAPDNR
jgi:hypothetical protein